MKLSPHDLDKKLLSDVGFLAQKRLARGLRLNIPEAIALLVFRVLELARDGHHTVAELMNIGRSFLGLRQVLPGVSSALDEVQIEGTFPDGTKLVTLHNPICCVDGDLQLALAGSFLPVPELSAFTAHPEDGLILGQIFTRAGNISINVSRDQVLIRVTNTSDRPIQVGSHYHFIETNPALSFDRRASFGKRLNIAAGTAVRFEPGDSKTVSLVDIAGNRIIRGGNGLCDGFNDIDTIMQRVLARGFASTSEISTDDSSISPAKRSRVGGSDSAVAVPPPVDIPRHLYARMFGPTTGDIVRLADTDLFVRVEYDHTVYGDECKFGGGKVLREGMGQATGVPTSQQLDTVITNALIVDYSGIFKADIGIKNGLICGIGKAGNPDVMAGVTRGMIVGVNTEAIAGEGLIITAGGVDTHVHFICPQLCDEAIASGVTTLLGGGTGPASGTCATTCTPSPAHLKMMLQATDDVPLNFAFTGKGNTSDPIGLRDIIHAGAVGLKLHEDWGTTPAAIRNCLAVANEEDIQVTIHTDTLNESCCVDGTLEAIGGNSIHTYHSEGAGGGHAPDIIVVCSYPNVIPSSTNPTRPLTVNTVEEHLDMLMVCHHLDKTIAEDVAFAESRIRRETIAAEDILHDIGAISIISSDSQAMGRIGETITRTWQTAHKMKLQRGQLAEDAAADAADAHIPDGIKTDNFRVRRYVAKYTVNPCIAHGMGSVIGSVEVGKLADLVLWRPAFFGVRPEMIIKGGQIAWSQMGDPNASIPTPQPSYIRPMYASKGRAASECSVAFISKHCLHSGIAANEYGLKKQLKAVVGCRGVGKKDMKLNNALPVIKVDPETYSVTADGVLLTCEPLDSLPLSQRYFLF